MADPAMAAARAVDALTDVALPGLPWAVEGVAFVNVYAPPNRQINHLVRSNHRGTPGPTLCGLSRFDRPDRKADLPGWSINGGVFGPSVEQVPCRTCWSVAP